MFTSVFCMPVGFFNEFSRDFWKKFDESFRLVKVDISVFENILLLKDADDVNLTADILQKRNCF